MKTKLKKEIRSWRKEGGERNGYIVLKKEYRRLCEEKKKKERELGEGDRGDKNGGTNVEGNK